MNAAPVPSFTGKRKLSLSSDLQPLADAVKALQRSTELVPGTPHRGRVQYGLANYTSTAITGLKPEDSEPGMVAGVYYDPTADFPHILEGDIIHPMAQDYETIYEDGTRETTLIPGMLAGVMVSNGSLGRTIIMDGELRIPLASTTWGEDTSINVPGYVYDVEISSGISAPTIKEGVILLPEGMGGACPLAEYDPENEGSAVSGRIGAISWGSSILAPRIDAGHIRIPTAHAESRSAMRMGAVEWLGWDPAAFADSSILMTTAVGHPRITEGQAFIPPGVLGITGADGRRYSLAECRGGVEVATLSTGATGGDVTSPSATLRVRWDDGFLAFEFV